MLWLLFEKVSILSFLLLRFHERTRGGRVFSSLPPFLSPLSSHPWTHLLQTSSLMSCHLTSPIKESSIWAWDGSRKDAVCHIPHGCERYRFVCREHSLTHWSQGVGSPSSHVVVAISLIPCCGGDSSHPMMM